MQAPGRRRLAPITLHWRWHPHILGRGPTQRDRGFYREPDETLHLQLSDATTLDLEPTGTGTIIDEIIQRTIRRPCPRAIRYIADVHGR